jgi:hypothetical protein
MKKQFVRFLIVTFVFLQILIATFACSTNFNYSKDDTTYLTPIPMETLNAHKNLYPIDSRLDAVIAAQKEIGYSGYRSEGTPRVIYAERLNYDEAKGTILPPNASNRDADVKDNQVWFVVFEGRWSFEGGPLPPEPTWTSTLTLTPLPTPTFTSTSTPSPACIFVLFLGSEGGDGLTLGGIKNCEQWKENLNIDIHN